MGEYTNVEVHTQRLYIYLPVWRESHPVHTQQRLRSPNQQVAQQKKKTKQDKTYARIGVHGIGNLADRTDRPRDVRDVRTSHQPGLVREQGLEVCGITVRILGVGGRPPFHR